MAGPVADLRTHAVMDARRAGRAAQTARLRFGRALACMGLAAWLVSAPAFAEMIWTVEPGDTLMDIAAVLLDDPTAWRKLQEHNGVLNPYQLEVGRQLRIPKAWVNGWSRSALVTTTGKAQIDGRPAEEGMRVGQGSQLVTGDDGHISIALPDGSVLVLPARSEATIQQLRGDTDAAVNNVDVAVQRGRVESRVTPQRGPAPRYRIETPTAVIGVRGTEFRVAWDGDARQTRTEVTQGEVAVTATNAASAPRSLAAGYGMVNDVRGGAQPVPLLPAPVMNAFTTGFDRLPVRLAPPDAASLPGVQAWRMQVLPEGSDQVVFDARVALAGEARVAGLQDGTYRLRVRGIDAQGLEGFDAEQIFRVHAHPQPPFINEPYPHAKVASGSVGFYWTQALDAASYRYEVAALTAAGDDAAFAQPLHQGEVSETGVSLTLAPGEYAWRVASVRANGARGPWSDAVPFVVRGPQEAPAPPEIGADEMIFRWQAHEDAQRFVYQLAADLHFRQVLGEGEVTKPELVMARPDPDTYYLRIRAIDADGFTSDWSTTQRVVVPASRPWWMLLFLPALAL